jgi:hypothetical protein
MKTLGTQIGLLEGAIRYRVPPVCATVSPAESGRKVRGDAGVSTAGYMESALEPTYSADLAAANGQRGIDLQKALRSKMDESGES